MRARTILLLVGMICALAPALPHARLGAPAAAEVPGHGGAAPVAELPPHGYVITKPVKGSEFPRVPQREHRADGPAQGLCRGHLSQGG